MRVWAAALFIATALLGGCGADGEPVPPGAETGEAAASDVAG